MLHIISMLMLLINSLLLTQMSHPLSMGMILLIQTIIICIMTGLSSNAFWFSYILFLVFIGGMLILFIYMASLSPNEKLNFSLKTFISIFINFTFLCFLFIDKFYIVNWNNFESNKMSYFMNFLNENYLNLSKLYELPNNMIIILLISYLLLTLIVVVKITNSFMGPLRPKN